MFSYTYAQHNVKINRIRRQCGGGKIMFWGVAMSNGLIFVTRVPSIYRSQQYIEILAHYLVPLMKLNGNIDSFLVQDNSRIHTSYIVKNWINDNHIRNIEWPANSPDMNLFENVWKLMSDIVYDGEQFRNIGQLTEKINHAVYLINTSKRDIIKSMFNNYTCRLTKLLINHGNRLK